MPCRDCGRDFSYARSEYCVGCAAIHTLGSELREEWPSDQLRRIGADLIVSTARTLRALRLHRCISLPPPPPVPRVVEDQRRSLVGGQRQGWRTFSPRREERQQYTPRETGRRSPSLAQRRRPERPEREIDYSYYSTSSAGDQEPVDEATAVRSAEAKSKAKPRSTSGDRRGREKSSRVKEEPDQEVNRGGGANSPRIPGIRQARVEAGTAEDKELSKEAYLKQLKEKEDRQRSSVHLEERPRSRERGHLHPGQLKLADDLEKGERKRKRRRPPQWWCPNWSINLREKDPGMGSILQLSWADGVPFIFWRGMS